MLKNGNRLGRHLFHDIKNRGYTGSRSNLERLLEVWCEAENIQPDDPPPDWNDCPWSNGQAEGQINCLKMLKRAMYGRAGPELIRARMLPLNHRN